MSRYKTIAPKLLNAAKAHWQNWKGCNACGLCEGRTRVVLWQGEIPSDVVFVGEAPGLSEDVMGIPFIGESGHLLDHLIDLALEDGWFPHVENPPSYSITNIVGCIPKDEDGKTRQPKRPEAEACAGRLQEFLALANPKLVVTVGRVAEKFLSLQKHQDYETTSIIHPSAILQAKGSDQTLKYKRAGVNLTNAFTKLAEAFNV